MKKIELLAPAGNFETFIVAIQSGANAIYLAGKNFGARAFSDNFSNNELQDAVRFAHTRNVKVYVTVNTIIFPDEWDDIKQYLHFLYEIGVDAIIVQDLGIVNYVRCNYPDFEVHASTQMNVYDASAALILKKLGVKRIVLARETPLEVVKQIIETGIEVEVFAHGALCFSASGNCLMSYMIGNRSGNRGKCAQPCRKSYSLYENNQLLLNKKSILSMKDLNTINHIDQLIDIGVSSLKIEGRMKSKEYVYSTISSYRKVIDNYYNKEEVTSCEKDIIDNNLLTTFNRSFTKGYLFNENNNNIVNINCVNHQGLEIGHIHFVSSNYIEIKLTSSLNVKDAIRINDKNEVGFIVNQMYVQDKLVDQANANEIVKIKVKTNVSINSKVVKTQSAIINNITEQLLTTENYKEKLNAKLILKLNEPMKLILEDNKNTVMCEGIILKDVANKSISYDFIYDRFNKFKNTIYSLEHFELLYDDKAFLSIKDLNELRRNAMNLLIEKRCIIIRTNDNPLHLENRNIHLTNDTSFDFVVHNIDQMEILNKYKNKLFINNIFTDFNSTALNFGRLSSYNNQYGFVHNLSHLNCGNVVSPYLNVSNSYSVDLLEKLGANIIYLSVELDNNQISQIIKRNSSNIGIMIYGKNDLMVTKHCIVSNAKGYSYKKCNECINKKYYIKDEFGNIMNLFPEKNNDCVNRIISYKTINRIDDFKFYKNLNINHFLVVFTDESSSQVEIILKKLVHLMN